MKGLGIDLLHLALRTAHEGRQPTAKPPTPPSARAKPQAPKP